MEFLTNTQLVQCTGKLVDHAKVLKNIRIVAYYFSASWCAPCKLLLTKIKEIYKANKTYQAGLEIIYVSSDLDADQAFKYYKERHGGWYAAPFDDDSGQILRIVFDINYLPEVIVTKTDGTIISRTGTRDIEEHGIDVLVQWNCDPV